MANLSPIQLARFWSRVQAREDFQCWEWQGRKGPKGYGRYGSTMAHRVAYELIVGPIPDGLLIRHKCDNPPCCNPKHLIPGTVRENAQDAVERGQATVGAKNGRAKLTEDQVREILVNRDRLGIRDFARKFNVSPSTVSLIRSGARWARLAR